MSADTVVKLIWTGVVTGVVFSIIVVVRHFLEKRDALRSQQLSLVGQKIKFDTESQPIDKLIDGSNADHGVVKPTGNTPVQK